MSERVYPEDLHIAGVDKPHKSELQSGKDHPTADETQLRRITIPLDAQFLEGIRRCGVIKPVVVRPIPNKKSDARVRYEVVDGRQRVRALRQINTESAISRDLPIVVRKGDDHRMISMIQAIANSHNIADSLYDKARQAAAFRNQGVSLPDIAMAMMTTEVTLSRWLRFVDEASDELKVKVADGRIALYDALGRIALAKDAGTTTDDGDLDVPTDDEAPAPKRPRATGKAPTKDAYGPWVKWAASEARQGVEYRESRRSNPSYTEVDMAETIAFFEGTRASLPYWLENAISHPTVDAPARPGTEPPKAQEKAPKAKKAPREKKAGPTKITVTEDDEDTEATE
jgi:ParB-like chromosome segregation protein Spo0J